MIRFSGTVWRHIPAGASALHVGYILRASGRWNRRDQYGCLYTSETKAGSIGEYRKYLESAGIEIGLKPREVVSLEVSLKPAMDLTDEDMSPVPTDSPFLTGDDPDDFEQCRALADSLRALEFVALIVPSAAVVGTRNIIIYVDGPPSGIRLEEGSIREAIES